MPLWSQHQQASQEEPEDHPETATQDQDSSVPDPLLRLKVLQIEGVKADVGDQVEAQNQDVCRIALHRPQGRGGDSQP